MDETYKLLGKNFFYRKKTEKFNLKYRRSIFVVKNFKKGEKFSKKNIRRIRPGYGASPIYYEKVLGRKSTRNLSAGTPFNIQYAK